jgi:hypothetical protein
MPVSDTEIVEAIRAVLAATPFHGEGHRKVRARLAQLNAETLSRRPAAARQLFGALPPRLRAVVSDAVGPEGAAPTRYRAAFAQYFTDHKRRAPQAPAPSPDTPSNAARGRPHRSSSADSAVRRSG